MSRLPDRNTAIDALRGIAAFAVLVFHSRQLLWVGLSAWLATGELDWFSSDKLLGIVSLPFRWGKWGVALFFVISGYCIHRPQAQKMKIDPGYRLSLKRYAARRLLRIYPVLIAALVLTSVLDHVTRELRPLDAQLGTNSITCFISNLCTLQNLAGPTYGSNLALWTLSIELHFYAIYPLLFWALGRIGLFRCMVIVFCVTCLSWLVLETMGYASQIFLPYWFTWMMGVYVAEAEVGNVSFHDRLLGVPAMLCVLIAMSVSHWKWRIGDPQPLIYTLLSLPFAMIVWNAVSRPSNWFWKNKIIQIAAMIGIGSYSLYATHMPVLIAYRAYFLNGEPCDAFVAVFPGIILALAVGGILYFVVEQWTLRLPSRNSRTRANEPIGRPTIPAILVPRNGQTIDDLISP